MYVQRKFITLKTAKVKEQSSGAKVVITQLYVKEIAIRHRQVVQKTDTVSKFDRKNDGKWDAGDNKGHSNSQEKVSLANTAVSNRKVALMQTATSEEDNCNITKCKLLLDNGS